MPDILPKDAKRQTLNVKFNEEELILKKASKSPYWLATLYEIPLLKKCLRNDLTKEIALWKQNNLNVEEL
ncbi:hypothetical protein [Xenorhabdus sp. NBAII XenSa04]|uniref:hypothetical protein n=1 Tax=Xenorhabdus TaxID=626 RepID=UPI00064600AF